MLFGEWLEKEFGEKYNDKFKEQLNEQQLLDKTELDLTIMTSGHMELMSDWMTYKAWGC